MYWFILLSNLVIVQVLFIDIGLTKLYPLLLILYMPFQFLCPALFTGFTYSYLGKSEIFKKSLVYFLIPFILFLGLYTFLKINVIMDYAFLSMGVAANIGAEFDENSAVAFSLLMAIWNYRVIKEYESSIGRLPYKVVLKKTRWLKKTYIVMVFLCILWLLVIMSIKLFDSWSGHVPYYPLWTLFIAFYYSFLFQGEKHLKELGQKKNLQESELKSINGNFQVSALRNIFSTNELISIHESQDHITEILSYFATSLFDKKNEEDVVWDITKNCIAKLGLEDCVIYIFDKNRNVLVQKAAYGNKDNGNKKILSPLEIPLGKGIVGSAAKKGEWEMVKNIERDGRYILDDKNRKSELAVPIINNGELIGVLDSENSEKDFFNEKHLLLFQLIAKLTATKLSHLGKQSLFELTDDNAYYKELLNWFEEERPYLDPYLDLLSVSNYLKISVGYLSQIVNKLSGTNFSDFINMYRLNEAKDMLANPSFSNYTIIAIGLESGFNSKSTFYNAFKKKIGITPSEYRQMHLMMS